MNGTGGRAAIAVGLPAGKACVGVGLVAATGEETAVGLGEGGTALTAAQPSAANIPKTRKLFGIGAPHNVIPLPI